MTFIQRKKTPSNYQGSHQNSFYFKLHKALESHITLTIKGIHHFHWSHPPKESIKHLYMTRNIIPICCLHFKQITAEELNGNHRITECSGLEGTSVGHPVQPSCQSRVTQSRLHRTASRRVLNISREGDSTISLGNHKFIMHCPHYFGSGRCINIYN